MPGPTSQLTNLVTLYVPLCVPVGPDVVQVPPPVTPPSSPVRNVPAPVSVILKLFSACADSIPPAVTVADVGSFDRSIVMTFHLILVPSANTVVGIPSTPSTPTAPAPFRSCLLLSRTHFMALVLLVPLRNIRGCGPFCVTVMLRKGARCNRR